LSIKANPWFSSSLKGSVQDDAGPRLDLGQETSIFSKKKIDAFQQPATSSFPHRQAGRFSPFFRRLLKSVQMQGARILRNEAYMEVRRSDER
jgi:hypothetical protein